AVRLGRLGQSSQLAARGLLRFFTPRRLRFNFHRHNNRISEFTLIVILRSPNHDSDFWCGDDMVQAWVASPLARERGRVRVAFKATNAAARQIQPLTFILSPSPRGEATSHPRELILILRDFQMMSLATRITRL